MLDNTPEKREENEEIEHLSSRMVREFKEYACFKGNGYNKKLSGFWIRL